MSFISVAAGQPIRATHVQQFTNWLTGIKLDTPGTIACTSTTEYTLTVRSQDGGTGLALNVLYGASGSPSTIATFNKSQIMLAVPVRVTGTSAFVLPQLASTPATAGASMVGFYAKTDATLAYQVGTAAAEYLLMPNPLTATGDMLYSSSGTTAARLAKGTAYQELVMNAGATAPTWASGALALVQTAGDVVVGSTANALQRVAAGTATQVLIGGTAPAFGAVTTAMMATNAASVLLLTYTASTDLHGSGGSGAALTAGTWTDLTADQSFTTTTANSIVDISVRVGNPITSATGATQLAARILVDGATAYPVGASIIAASNGYASAFEGCGPVRITGLSVASHTVRIQVAASSNSTSYCRASGGNPYEFAVIQVVEYKR